MIIGRFKFLKKDEHNIMDLILACWLELGFALSSLVAIWEIKEAIQKNQTEPDHPTLKEVVIC